MARRYSAVRKQVKIRVSEVKFEMADRACTGSGKLGRRNGVVDRSCDKACLWIGHEAGVIGRGSGKAIGFIPVGEDL